MYQNKGSSAGTAQRRQVSNVVTKTQKFVRKRHGSQDQVKDVRTVFRGQPGSASLTKKKDEGVKPEPATKRLKSQGMVSNNSSNGCMAEKPDTKDYNSSV